MYLSSWVRVTSLMSGRLGLTCLKLRYCLANINGPTTYGGRYRSLKGTLGIPDTTDSGVASRSSSVVIPFVARDDVNRERHSNFFYVSFAFWSGPTSMASSLSFRKGQAKNNASQITYWVFVSGEEGRNPSIMLDFHLVCGHAEYVYN